MPTFLPYLRSCFSVFRLRISLSGCEYYYRPGLDTSNNQEFEAQINEDIGVKKTWWNCCSVCTS